MFSASFWSYKNSRFLLTRHSLEGTAVRRSLRVYKTVKTIIIRSLILVTMWHRFLILQGEPNWLMESSEFQI